MKQNKGCMIGIIIAAVFLGIILIAGVSLISTYISTNNDIIALREETDAQMGNVQAALQTRADQIPNLMNSVEAYMRHEKDTYALVSGLRNDLGAFVTTDENGNMKIRNDLNASETERLDSISEQLVNEIKVVVERYPELKSDTLMQGFMDEITSANNVIRVQRENYIKAINKYNTRIQQFPGSIIASMKGYEKLQQYKASEEAQTNPQVQFNN